MENKRAILLLSGGIDSTTLLAKLSSENYDVIAISFHYGQKHGIELNYAKNNAEKYNVKKHNIIELDKSLFNSSALVNKEIDIETYALEELTAELTALFLCADAGIAYFTLENSAAYIQGWNKKVKELLKEDNKAIFKAAAEAQKARDYIMGGNSLEDFDPETWKPLSVLPQTQINSKTFDKMKRLRLAEIEAKIRLQKMKTDLSGYDKSDEIDKATNALDTVIKTQNSVHHAFCIDEIGCVSLLYGKEGNANKNFAGGYGISHIIAKREMEYQKNKKGLNGIITAYKLMDVLVYGEIHKTVESKQTVHIRKDGYEAILSLKWQADFLVWLLTGYKLIE